MDQYEFEIHEYIELQRHHIATCINELSRYRNSVRKNGHNIQVYNDLITEYLGKIEEAQVKLSIYQGESK